LAEVKWIKLSVGMFEDEKIRLIEALPEADTILIIWVKLLAQAGKTNASGYIYLNERIPYTDEMLSTIFNRPITTVRLALKTFEQFGMIEVTDDHFISISNWDKHQNLDGLDKIRQQTKKRVAEHRQRKKEMLPEQPCNVTETHGNATEEEGDIDKEEDKEREKEEEEASASTANCFDFYQKNFSLLTPHLSQKIGSWIDDFNGNHDVIIKALEITLERNKRTWSYAEGILKDWYVHKVRTLPEIEAYEHRPKINIGTHQKQNGRKSLFEQGEESKKRQGAIKTMTAEEEAEMRRLEEELPY
jgi:predicted phage replisome organizer